MAAAVPMKTDEKQTIGRVFSYFDRDGDGLISEAELDSRLYIFLFSSSSFFPYSEV
jgi:Ca2+-binding EF-hand superfamily protein